MKNVMKEKDFEELKQQKTKFIEECDAFEEKAYQKDKGLIYYSQIALYKYAKIVDFAKKILKKDDFDSLTNLLQEQNEAIFEEYERLNYLYYELGKSKKSSNNNA